MKKVYIVFLVAGLMIGVGFLFFHENTKHTLQAVVASEVEESMPEDGGGSDKQTFGKPSKEIISEIGDSYSVVGNESFIGVRITNSITCGSIPEAKVVWESFSSPVQVRRPYESITNATCQTPLQLIMSDDSSIDNDWQRHNYLNNEDALVLTDEQFERRKSVDKSKNGVDVIGVLNVDYNEESHAIVKYWLVDDGGRSMTVARRMKNVDGRWYFSAELPNELSSIVRRVKAHNLEALFSPQLDPLFYDPDLYYLTRGASGSLDVEKLLREIVVLRKNEEQFYKLCDQFNEKGEKGQPVH